MAKQVLIIHGWSDHSDSFRALAAFLAGHGYQAKMLWLGDYISMEDDVRVQDVAIRMAEVIDAMMASGELALSFDVIVHSTGGLVARAWLTTRYKGEAEKCPMKRLIMLAPANYGSKLAAVGKSMLGRIFKGAGNGFHTGTSMLNDLELASPFQWELAQRDVLVAPGSDQHVYYGDDRVWPFVIVGTHGYGGWRSVANEAGSDGTVRVCAANLNAYGATIDFRETDPKKMVTTWTSRLPSEAPLAVLPTRTHGTVIDPDRVMNDSNDGIAESSGQKGQLGKLILEALGCSTFAEYGQLASSWQALTEATAAIGSEDIYHQYMQLNAYVVDDHGKPVPDYFLEFFSNADGSDDPANVYLHGKVIEDVKKNSQNEALRNIYLDRTDLMTGYYPLAGANPAVYLSVWAAPPGDRINYFDKANPRAKGMLRVHVQNQEQSRWLHRNCTHFVQIIIPRRPGDKVFELKRYG